MSLAHAIQSLMPFLGKPDPRNEREIDDDLDAEFAFHLEQAARDLISEGHAPDVACVFAKERFGDLERYKKQCKRIALKERIMLQRVNFIMMIVVMLMVIGVGVQVWITQRYNTLALMDITAQIAKMRMDASAEARDRGWGEPAITNIEPPDAPPKTDFESGEWREFDMTSGKEVDGGARLLILNGDDVQNVAGVTGGLITLPGASKVTGLMFARSRPPNVTLYEEMDGKLGLAKSRFQIDQHGNLVINFATLRSGPAEPMTFRHVETAGVDLSDVAAAIADIRRGRFPGASNTANANGAGSGRDIRREKFQQFSRMTAEIFGRTQPNGDPLPRREALEAALEALETEFADDPQYLAEFQTMLYIQLNALNDGVAEAATQPAFNPLHRSPFRAVKWSDWTPFVDVQGQWYELLAVDTIPVGVLIEQTKKLEGVDPRRMISEELVRLLQESGRTVGDSVRLDVRDIASGTTLAIGEAQLTAENHTRVQKANADAKDAGEEYPKFVTSDE